METYLNGSNSSSSNDNNYDDDNSSNNDYDETSDIDLDNYNSVILLSKESINNNNNNNNNKKTLKRKNDDASIYQDDCKRLLSLSEDANKSLLSFETNSEMVNIISNHEKIVSNGTESFIVYASTEMPREHVECLIMFKEEIKLIRREYAQLVHRQQLLRNFNTNSTSYSGEMIKKMINIILKIDNNMPIDKYKDVVREALYIYHLVVSKMTGPKHLKRLRTPELHFDFCTLIALLSHNVEIVKNISTKYRVSSIIQFVSALDCQWYLSVVPNILSVFNRSNSICQTLCFSYERHAQVNITLCLTYALTEINTTNLVLGVILYLFPECLEDIKRAELIKDESLIVPLARKIMEHLRSLWIEKSDIANAAHFLLGSCVEGLDTIKVFRKQNYDKKILAVSVMVQQKLKQLAQSMNYY